MRAPHSTTPAAFQTEAPHQECAGQGKVSQNQARRNWKKKLFLQPPELGDDSDLSSSSGSIVPYVHPTEGKTHLSIKDTEDYLTVQNPNPHTGRMSPAFSSVMTEHHEPITLRGAKDAVQASEKDERRAFEDQRPRDRWPDFWRPLRKVSTLKSKPPAPYVEDEIEEPPDGLSDVSPLHAQPSPTHFAAFDPDHLRIPGALRVSPPPPKTKTNEGTDAIATWVTTGSRRVYELPAASLPPPEMELPSVPQHEPSSSRHVRFSDDCPVRYPFYSPSPLAPPPPPHQLPTPPHTPQFATIEISRKPLAHECEDAPPVPPKHGYIPKTWSQSTQTRASVVSSRCHPIEHGYQSDTVSVEKVPTRLNGNGVPRIVVTTGKKTDQDKEGKDGDKKEKEKDTGKEKEGDKTKSKIKKREKGYRREKELLQPEAAKEKNPIQRQKEREKEKTDQIGEQQHKPKSKPKLKTCSTTEPPQSTTKTAAADRNATLKAALERIAAAKAKRVVSAPARATTTTAAAAAAPITKDPARSKSNTASGIPTTTKASRPLSSSTAKAATTTHPSTTPQTQTTPQPLVSLTITRANAIFVGKALLALWGLLAAFYLLGALGRALWVVLVPVRMLLRGLGSVGGCVRGAGW